MVLNVALNLLTVYVKCFPVQKLPVWEVWLSPGENRTQGVVLKSDGKQRNMSKISKDGRNDIKCRQRLVDTHQLMSLDTLTLHEAAPVLTRHLATP